MTIFGWDASDFDWDRGPMDLAAARRDGIDFFTHKATESTNVTHKHYDAALNRARDAGIPFLGAYHVVRSNTTINKQVDYFLNYVDAQTPWWRHYSGWFFQVDLEKWPYDNVDASKGENFADVLEARVGRKAIIYASKGQYGDSLSGTSHALWNANYGTNAKRAFKQLYQDRGGDQGSGWGIYSRVTPAIWQYGSEAIIGSQHTCDANAFRGNVRDFARLIGVKEMAMEEDYGIAPNPSDGRTTATRVVDMWSGEMEAKVSGYGYPTGRQKRLMNMDSKLDQILAALDPAALAAKLIPVLVEELPDQVSSEMLEAAFSSPKVQAILKQNSFEGAQEAEKQ